jgi:hypothetical protein
MPKQKPATQASVLATEADRHTNNILLYPYSKIYHIGKEINNYLVIWLTNVIKLQISPNTTNELNGSSGRFSSIEY